MAKWLISYRYCDAYPDATWPYEDCAFYDVVELIAVHPATYVALHVADADQAFRDGRAGSHITRVYSATEVPDGTLSDEDAELLAV